MTRVYELRTEYSGSHGEIIVKWAALGKGLRDSAAKLDLPEARGYGINVTTPSLGRQVWTKGSESKIDFSR
ncbi:MAG: hypothetical protein Q7O66_23385 [Dehalococcoidia bacterium]|nr:hypothetical protein [Dehalococcoidia bacterium]